MDELNQIYPPGGESPPEVVTPAEQPASDPPQNSEEVTVELTIGGYTFSTNAPTQEAGEAAIRAHAQTLGIQDAPPPAAQ